MFKEERWKLEVNPNEMTSNSGFSTEAAAEEAQHESSTDDETSPELETVSLATTEENVSIALIIEQF